MNPKVSSNVVVVNPATGPKTAAGKKASSRNSQKAAIFSQGYLSWEDPQAQQLQTDALSAQWRAYDPTRHLILRGIEQANLCLERMMRAERLMIEGKMHNLDLAQRFASQIGWSAIQAMNIPTWFFKEGGADKEYAPFIHKALAEAKLLRNQYSDRLAGEIAKHFPSLSEYILEGQRSGYSVLVTLGQRYKLTTPTLNLNALIAEVEELYRNHLIWAQDAPHYEAIIDGLRAQEMLSAMDLEKSSRYATTFQNRILKGFTALAALDQHEHQQGLLTQASQKEKGSHQASNGASTQQASSHNQRSERAPKVVVDVDKDDVVDEEDPGGEGEA